MNKEYPNDNSGGLFDYLIVKLRCKTDGALAQKIGTKPSVISEIRNGKREMNNDLLVRICNVAEISLKKAQTLISYKDGAK